MGFGGLRFKALNQEFPSEQLPPLEASAIYGENRRYLSHFLGWADRASPPPVQLCALHTNESDLSGVHLGLFVVKMTR